jgi:multiple sugar transport system permease protein
MFGWLGEGPMAYLMNVPALVVILSLIAFPIGYSFWLSLQRYNLKQPGLRRFLGLSNYVELFGDPAFRNSITVSAAFAVVVVTLTIVMSMTAALVLNETFLGRGFLRSLILLPWAMPGVVNGLMWRWIFDAKVGALNGALTSLGLIDSYQAWLTSPVAAFFIACVAEVWNILPLAVIILLAGLSTIPNELYDAARVDRANVVQRFRHVTLPWMLHPLLVVLILMTMTSFRAFDVVYVLTGGGPGDATNVIALQTARTAFAFTDFGRGNAYAYIITLVTLLISVIYVSLLYRRGRVDV